MLNTLVHFQHRESAKAKLLNRNSVKTQKRAEAQAHISTWSTRQEKSTSIMQIGYYWIGPVSVRLYNSLCSTLSGLKIEGHKWMEGCAAGTSGMTVESHPRSDESKVFTGLDNGWRVTFILQQIKWNLQRLNELIPRTTWIFPEGFSVAPYGIIWKFWHGCYFRNVTCFFLFKSGYYLDREAETEKRWEDLFETSIMAHQCVLSTLLKAESKHRLAVCGVYPW